MEFNDSSDEKDVKPIINDSLGAVGFPELNSTAKKWSPGSWQDATRKSAFQPYKQKQATVLTNLQRGNTQAATPIPQPTDINFHTRAGQGEITELDIKQELCVDTCDENGLTALHWASNYGQINAVKLLIEHKADVNRVGTEGEAPLLLAANGGHHEVVKHLLTKGANVNHVDDVGNSALMYAASGNHPHSCNELLIHGANLNIVNHSNETAFSLSVDYGSKLAQAVMENFILDLLK
ncbi:PREDICTED: DNA-binding protein RFXANK-like [Nicrophorus vespilloides]|uniref:DNA-binding protein RFXANK-like n=1 Tax=Nicrophorus vespilloides TaxID=110193 RepID=A0ABM1MG12_NICVS|nr:PREDICTED: DNA-binding protein RFXANK-like [Nicrophorus vespilloides]